MSDENNMTAAAEVSETPADTTAAEEQTQTASPLTEEQLAEAFEKEAEKVPQEQSIFKDANGGFNWGLLAVILAVAMFIVAVVWLMAKAIKVFGSALLIILALGVIVYTVFHIRE